MPRAQPLPPPLSERPFAVGEASALRIPRSRLRASDLSAPFHGVRAPSTRADLPRAYAARMAPTERFTHTTAALLHGMRMPRGFHEEALHVGAARSARAPRSAGVVGHQVPSDSPTVTRDGLRVSPPVLAWIQCAELLSVDDLIVMGDGLVARHKPVASLRDVESAVAASGGGRGVRDLRAALRDIRPGTDSAMETVVRQFLVRSGFPEPEVNGAVKNEYGAVIAHGDLVFRRWRVVIEYDGAVHFEHGQYVRDIARLDDIMELGWRVIRVDSGLLGRRATLPGKVSRALQASS